MGSKVLVVDDDAGVLSVVSAVLRRSGYEVLALNDSASAIEAFADPAIEAVVSDVVMPGPTGLDLLQVLKRARPDVEVILMTGNATLETAMASVRGGAYAYLTKPFERIDDVPHTVRRALERRALRRRTETLEDAVSSLARYQGMIGQSPQMKAVFDQVEAVKGSMATVLIRGESGTGKELIAKALHLHSPRRDKPFVVVNYSAPTETLLDSELFGHVKGAFTGAVSHKKGLFEAAHGGSLFLDEIGDISPATQVRLLRVLQEGEVKRVGGNDTIHVDVRVIAATHVDLERARTEGRFRDDLFYRLNVVTLNLPALRERASDVALLAHHFIKTHAEKNKRSVKGLTPAALERLTTYPWPGNVRELENVIERAVLFCARPLVDVDDLPAQLTASADATAEAALFSLAHLPFAQAKALTVAAFERRYVATALERSNNSINQAAANAGMDRSNFRRLMKSLGLSRRSAPDEEAAGDA